MKLLIVGPFFTSYSLAIANRNIFRALLNSGTDVFVYLDKNYLDYSPQDSEIENSIFKGRVLRELTNDIDAVFFYHFPKSVNDDLGLSKFKDKFLAVCIAWEDVVYPKHFVEELNKYAHVVFAISNFVRDVLVANGVNVPVMVLHHAFDQNFTIEKFDLPTTRTFKFLHISSGKKRKGIDVLVKSFDRAFSDQDDVTLILKTSNIPDDDTRAILKQRKGNAHLLHFYNDLTFGQINYLQSISQCHVYPSRSEGFGLPILEAMGHKKLVITTRYSGQIDFCNDENSVLIDYRMKDAYESEIVFVGSKWAEPDANQLTAKMREIYESFKLNNLRDFQDKMEKGFQTARTMTWQKVADNLNSIISNFNNITKLKKCNFALLSPFNDQTGISEHSELLTSGIRSSFAKFLVFANDDNITPTRVDQDFVLRNFNNSSSDFDELINDVLQNQVNIIHIQYHSSTFIDEINLDFLISKLTSMNVDVYVTCHSVRGKNFDHIANIKNLNLCKKVFVTSRQDHEYACTRLNNVVYLPLFLQTTKVYPKHWLRDQLSIDQNAKIITTHGLLNTNKSIPELIEAFSKFLKKSPNSYLLLLNAVSANNFAAADLKAKVEDLIAKLKISDRVIFIHDFLDSIIINRVISISDLYVLAYKDAGESGSAAVKKGLQNLVPTMVTDIKQFDEYTDEVIKIKNSKPDTLFEAFVDFFDKNYLNAARIDALKSKMINYLQKAELSKSELLQLAFYIE